MDIKGILTDVVSDWVKEKTIYIGEYEDSIAIILDNASRMYLIPKSSFIFDVKAITRGKGSIDINRLIEKPLKQAIDGTLTNDLRICNKRQLRKIEGPDFDVWIQDKFLKRFDPRTFKLKVTGPTGFVLIYENSDLAGVLCPVRMKEQNN